MPRDKMIYINKARHVHAPSPQSVADAHRAASLRLSPPQENLLPCIYRLQGSPQARVISCSTGSVLARWARSTPETLEERCQVSPHILPKGAISQPHAYFQLLVLGFPTLNSFSFQIYIQVFFFLCYQNSWEQRENKRVEKDHCRKCQNEKGK